MRLIDADYLKERVQRSYGFYAGSTDSFSRGKASAYWDVAENLIQSTMTAGQDTRLLTLKEVIMAPEGSDLYIEDRRENERGLLYAATKSTTGTVCNSFYLHTTCLNDLYGRYWRCWTARPTREQREAEPWES